MGLRRFDIELAARCEQVRAVLARGDRAQAEALAQGSSKVLRSREEYWLSLSSQSRAAQEHELAAKWAQRALRLNPLSQRASLLHAEALLELGEVGKAERQLAGILRDRPDHASANGLMAKVMLARGDFEQAGNFLRRCTEAPDRRPPHLSTHLYFLNFHPCLSPQQIFDAHRELGRVFAAIAGGASSPAAPRPSAAAGASRIGFVSGDFRGHALAFFTVALLRELRRQRVEVLGYYTQPHEDAATRQFKQLLTGWRCIAGISTGEAVRTVRSDGVDVLIDLGGHTDAARLDLFLHRAAPVQLTWLGYPNTTGLDCFDGRIVDSVTDPEGSDRLATEPLLRLDPCFLLYTPPIDAPPVVAPPCLDRGEVTFGSFNNFHKLNDDILDLWAAILREVGGGSRLALKSSRREGAPERERILKSLGERGVDASRVLFLDRRASAEEHLAAYAQVDIALDPFPYNGTTTTCEALWMGVPVVALLGDRHAARVSASILSAVGLGSCVARSRDEYVLTAALLARTPSLLVGMRGMLRESVLASPLCDAPGFTSSFLRLVEERLAAAARGVGSAA